MLIQDNNTIFAFLSNDDGMLQQRKDAFLRYLYAIADDTSLANFKNSIINNIFDSNYMATHRWPHTA